uniref:hypothetical protein n=1 Tax=Agathobacter sp. TaxID=2021311 RepID=UPI0040570C06
MKHKTMTEQQVKDILRNRETLLTSIHRKMSAIEQDMAKTDDMIETMSMPASPISGMPRGCIKQKDLGDVYRNYKKILKQRNEDYRTMFWELVMQEEMIERVWDAYMRLEEPYYSIINRMYVQSMLYAAVESESGWSRQVFEKKRKKGIQLIVDMVNRNEKEGWITRVS